MCIRDSFYDCVINNDLERLESLVERHKIDLDAKFTEVRKKNHLDLSPIHLVAYKVQYVGPALDSTDYTTLTDHICPPEMFRGALPTENTLHFGMEASVDPSYTAHTHPFSGPFSGTTRVSQYQKGKTNLDFTEARDIEWQ